MADKETAATTLNSLKSGERSIVLSFLEFSELPTQQGQTALDELALNLALKSSRKSSAN